MIDEVKALRVEVASLTRERDEMQEALAAARRECDRLRGVLTEIVDHGGANRGIWSQSQAKAALAAPAAGEEGKNG